MNTGSIDMVATARRAENGQDRTIEPSLCLNFREVTDITGLEEIFGLRYRCFRQSRLEGLVPRVDCGLDIDRFDLHARHFGLFCTTSTGEHLIGSHRHVTDAIQPAAAAIEILVDAHPELQLRFTGPVTQTFPSLTYFPDTAPILALYEQAKRRHELFIEASRLALSPEIGSLAVVRFFVSATLAAALANGVSQGITVVNSHRKRFYARFGFHAAPDLPDRFVEKTQCEMSVLVWDGKFCSDESQSEIARLKQLFKCNGHLELSLKPSSMEAA